MYYVNKNTAPGNILKLFSCISSVQPQPLNIFLLMNLDLMSNEMLSRVWGLKFGTGYLEFLKKKKKKDRRKTFKRSLKATLLDIFQTENSYIVVDTIIVKMKKLFSSPLFIYLFIYL